MPSIQAQEAPSLTPDEIDDLLYFVRVNELSDLQETITELTQKYSCPPRDILTAATDPESGNTVFHFCSANGFGDLLKTLLQQLSGTDSAETHDAAALVKRVVNTSNAQGNTPLHWASLNGHLDVVKLLLDAGAEISSRNSAGHLAVFEAERAGHPDVAEFLIEKGGLGLEGEDLVDVPSEEAEGVNGAGEVNGHGNGADAVVGGRESEG